MKIPFFEFIFEFQNADSVEICETQKSGNEIVLHCLNVQLEIVLSEEHKKISTKKYQQKN